MHRHLCSPGVFAFITIMLLPLSWWHCCCCQAGVVALVTMVSLPSLMCRHLHSCMMALLPLLCWCHCQHYTGVVALVALALLSLSRWPLCPHFKWALSPSLHWRCCPHQAGVFASLRWCCCPCHAGIVALNFCAGLFALIVFGVQLISRRLCPHWGHVLIRGRSGNHFADNSNTSATRATIPAQQGRQHQHNEGNAASTKWVTMPVQFMTSAWQELMQVHQRWKCGQGGRRRPGVWA